MKTMDSEATRITRLINKNQVKNTTDEQEVNRLLKRIEGRKQRIRRLGMKLAESQTFELALQ